MRIQYEHPDQGDDPQPDPFRGADEALAREIGSWIARNHPRQCALFHARVDHAKGVALIYAPMLAGGTNCFILHIPTLQSGPTVFHQEMLEACGQLLERYRLPRGRTFDADLGLERIRSISRIGLDQRPVPE